MRKLYIALLTFIALLAPAQQPPAQSPEPAGKMSIPAQLTRTVQADKAHPGDRVEFRTLEAVLAGKDLVIPANARLYGRVLSASPKQDDKNSWLAVVVERAEWKQHSLPLHAFISAQIVISQSNDQRAAEAEKTTYSPQNPRTRRQSARATLATDPTLSSIIKAPLDANETSQAELGTRYPVLDNVGIFRDKNGTTYLLSAKSSVKLPAGVLLMLRNEPGESSETAEGRPASGTSTDERLPH
ncbi:MAG TPA: hypothetical protein VKG65_03625 [Terriglobales bacterium]|nr:hypothetical protein [Terriglobales bacterium]